jgi:hypothetical protein
VVKRETHATVTWQWRRLLLDASRRLQGGAGGVETEGANENREIVDKYAAHDREGSESEAVPVVSHRVHHVACSCSWMKHK